MFNIYLENNVQYVLTLIRNILKHVYRSKSFKPFAGKGLKDFVCGKKKFDNCQKIEYFPSVMA